MGGLSGILGHSDGYFEFALFPSIGGLRVRTECASGGWILTEIVESLGRGALLPDVA